VAATAAISQLSRHSNFQALKWRQYQFGGDSSTVGGIIILQSPYIACAASLH